MARRSSFSWPVVMLGGAALAGVYWFFMMRKPKQIATWDPTTGLPAIINSLRGNMVGAGPNEGHARPGPGMPYGPSTTTNDGSIGR